MAVPLSLLVLQLSSSLAAKENSYQLRLRHRTLPQRRPADL